MKGIPARHAVSGAGRIIHHIPWQHRHLQEELRDRGIITNREVVIRKSERTDIHINAVIRNERREVYNSVTVIVEVKGCWNRELKMAMRTQLVERYLKDNHCQHGLYLIGWFKCDEWWGEGDDRKRDVPDMSIDEARKFFDAQAAELSQQKVNVQALVLDVTIR